MNITEMFREQDESEQLDKYMNPAEDNEIPKLDDLRKVKLTLGKINSLRLVRDVRNFEIKNNLENVRRQYGKPAETAPGM